MQGARIGTEDVRRHQRRRVGQAAKRAGGIWISGTFGMQPPSLGGALGDRFDVVVSMSGLDDFDTEYARSKALEVDSIEVRVLPLDRIIHSKRTANRPKDQAALPALEAALAVQRDEEDSRLLRSPEDSNRELGNP